MREQDDAVERTLAALGRADVPEGMETRLLAGLQDMDRRLASAGDAKFHWRDAVRGAGPVAGAWWRGALSGAAVAMLMVGVVFVVLHGLKVHGDKFASKSAPAVAKPALVELAIEREAVATPCSDLRPAQENKVAAGLRAVRVEGVRSAEPKALQATELTAEERELLRLARVPDPQVRATLNPDVRAKTDAEDVAQFESFFYQPPVKISTERDN